MKRCPKCRRVETDDALAFCRADGTTLVREPGADSENAGTLKFGSAPVTGEAGTSILPRTEAAPTTGEALNRPTAPTTVLDGRRASGGTEGLRKPKSRRRVVIAAAAVIALALAASAYIYLYRSAAVKNSVAVLPFQNASGDPNMEYLSDGISESLINSLSQLQDVRVLARSTMFRFKGQDADPQAVGKQLGVDAVLTGRVVQFGDSLSVQADLVSVSDGSQMWGERYNRKAGDILAVQEEIAREIVGKLRLRLTGEEQRRLTERFTDNPAAYELYLKGNYYSGSGVTEEGLRKAIDHYRRAISLDPNYALAYVGLAEAYLSLGNVWGFAPPRETLSQAQAALTRALELNDGLADAHVALGSYYLYYEWKWPEAERELRRAIELNPNHAGAHATYGSYFQTVGRLDEAIIERKKCRDLDPLSPTATANVGYPFYYKRQYDEAIAYYRKALELDPRYSWGHLWAGQAYTEKGMHDEAIAEVRKAVELSPGNVRAVATLGYAYAAAGRREEAEKIIAELQGQAAGRYTSPYFVAVIYAGLGEKEQAFSWLEKAYEERHPYLVLLKVEPVFDKLRPDPRFAQFMSKVGIPQ